MTVTLKENERFFGDSAASMVSSQPTPFPEVVSRGEEVTDPRPFPHQALASEVGDGGLRA